MCTIISLSKHHYYFLVCYWMTLLEAHYTVWGDSYCVNIFGSFFLKIRVYYFELFVHAYMCGYADVCWNACRSQSWSYRLL